MSGHTPFEEWWEARSINDRLMHLHHDRASYTEEGWNAGVFTERARLRERVKALREKAQGLYDGSIATEMIMKQRGKLDAYDAVLALLAEPGEVDGEPRT